MANYTDAPTLYYFPLRARGECFRMIMSYGGVKYNEKIVQFNEEWILMKEGNNHNISF